MRALGFILALALAWASPAFAQVVSIGNSGGGGAAFVITGSTVGSPICVPAFSGSTYQWYTGTPPSGSAIGGATSRCYTPPSAGSYYATATAAGTVTVAPPVNVVAPTVSSSNLQVGTSATTTNGTWNGSPTYTYAWQQNGAGAIGGATSASYTFQTSDIGACLNSIVKGTNSGGGPISQASSNCLGPIIASSGFTPIGYAGVPAAFFGDTNVYPSAISAASNYLTVPAASGGAGAFYIPAPSAGNCPNGLATSTICSWVLAMKVTIPNNQYYWSASASNSASEGFAGNCGSGASCGNNQFGLSLSSLNASATAARNGELKIENTTNSGQALWNPPATGGTYGGALTSPQTGFSLTQQNTTRCIVITQPGGDAPSGADGLMSVAILDNTGTQVAGSPEVATTQNDVAATINYYNTGSAYRTATSIGNLLARIGAVNNGTGAARATPGPMADVAMYWGVLKMSSSGVPDATVLANYCNGTATASAWASTAAQGGGALAIHSLYTLADAGTWADSGPNAFGNLTANGTVVAASPILQTSGLTIGKDYPGKVFRVTPNCNFTSGACNAIGYFEGTYNTASLGGTPSGIDVQVMNGATVVVPWTTVTANYLGSIGGGVWHGTTVASSGAAGNIPQSTCWPYTVWVRPTNAPSYVVKSSNPFGAGVRVFSFGQSQVALEYGTAATSSGNNVTIPGGVCVSSIQPNLIDSGNNYVTDTLNAHFGLISQIFTGNGTTVAGNENGNGSTSNVTGDGSATSAALLSQMTGMVVENDYFARAGNPIDEYLGGWSQGSGTLTGSGAGPYSVTSVNYPAMPTWVAGSPTFQGGTWATAQHGSIQVSDSTGIIAVDNGTGSATSASFSTYSGAGAATDCTVNAGGTILYAGQATYNGSVLSTSWSGLTFTCPSGGPAGSVTYIYTALNDPNSGAYGRTAAYTGYDAWGNGTDPTSGTGAQVASLFGGPASVDYSEQIGANGPEVYGYPACANNNSGGCQNVQLKQNNGLFRGRLGNGNYWWNDTVALNNTAVMWGNVPRLSGTSWISWTGYNQFFLNADTATGYSNPNYYGCTYGDDTLTSLVQGGQSPHADGGVFGSRRLNRRRAACLFLGLQGIDPKGGGEPYVDQVNSGFSTVTTGNHNAGCGTTGKCFDVVFIAPLGTQLETCDPSGFGETGVCTFRAYNDATLPTPPCRGFSFGPSATVQYDEYGNDEASTTFTLPAGDNAQSTCKIIGPLTVEYVFNTPLTPGSTYMRFDNPFERNGSMTAITNSTSGTWTGVSPQTIYLGDALFNGTITGNTTLTVNSGETPQVGQLLGSANGVGGGRYILSGTGPFTITSGANVSAVSMTGGGCTVSGQVGGTYPAITVTNTAGTLTATRANYGQYCNAPTLTLGASFTGTITGGTSLVASSVTGHLAPGMALGSANGVGSGRVVVSGSGLNWTVTSGANVSGVSMTAGFTGGSGTMTATLAAPADDIADMASVIYDNYGILHSNLFNASGAANGSEPGFEATPIANPVGPY